MKEGTKMQWSIHGFEGEEPRGNQPSYMITPVNFKFDSYQIIDNKLKIIGILDDGGSIEVYDAQYCRVVSEKVDEKGAILG